MPSAICPPLGDLGPNNYAATPSQAHYLNVREDPNDGDATILSTASAGKEVWAIDVSAIPDGAAITNVRIRTAQKQTTAGSNTFAVGFSFAGNDFLAPQHVQSAGATVEIFEDSFAINPVTGGVWSKGILGALSLVHDELSQPQGLPRPHLTECIVIADYLLPPPRPIGTEEAVTPAAAPSGGEASGIAVAIVDSISLAGIAPDGSPIVLAVSGLPAAAVANAAADSITTQGMIADPGKPSAIPASTCPIADPASIAPISAPAAVTGSGTGA